MTDEDLKALLAKPGYGIAPASTFALRKATLPPIPQGASPALVAKPKRAKSKPAAGPSESAIQRQLIVWWSLECKNRKLPEKLLMAFPLQGRRSAVNGARMKAEGMRAGTPDVFLAVARGKYHGLWIEMKKPGGKLSDSQKEFLPMLDAQGYAAYACYCLENATNLIKNYLDGVEFF